MVTCTVGMVPRRCTQSSMRGTARKPKGMMKPGTRGVYRGRHGLRSVNASKLYIIIYYNFIYYILYLIILYIYIMIYHDMYIYKIYNICLGYLWDIEKKRMIAIS